MNLLTPIPLNTIQISLAGFKRYVCHTIWLMATQKADIPANTIQGEKAFLNEEGNIVIIVKTANGEMVSEFVLTKDEFEHITHH